jgi:hypothetical protein
MYAVFCPGYKLYMQSVNEDCINAASCYMLYSYRKFENWRITNSFITLVKIYKNSLMSETKNVVSEFEAPWKFVYFHTTGWPSL